MNSPMFIALSIDNKRHYGRCIRSQPYGSYLSHMAFSNRPRTHFSTRFIAITFVLNSEKVIGKKNGEYIRKRRENIVVGKCWLYKKVTKKTSVTYNLEMKFLLH